MVSDQSSPRILRFQIGVVRFVLLIAGVLLAWAGSSALIVPLRRMAVHSILVEYPPHDVIALPLALTCFALAAMTFIPAMSKRSAQRRGTGRKGTSKTANYLFFLAVIGALSAVIVSPIAESIMTQVMTKQGYRTCPTAQKWERHPPVRFAIAQGQCP